MPIEVRLPELGENIAKGDVVRVLVNVGDLLQKAGRNDEAIAAYLKVADQFQRDGFDAKAVALYKQVTKIDDKRHDVYVPLADLYQRLGLVSEAMGALQRDGHLERQGDGYTFRIEGRTFGLLGEPRVNVLLLNTDLDRLDAGGG